MRLNFVFAALLSLILAACNSEQKKPLEPPPVDVTQFTVEPKTIPIAYDFVGFAESIHPVEIRARVEGYLDKIAYQEGQLVKEGDLLFQLDPKQYEAKVEEAKGEVARQEALLANAVLTVNRLTPLYEQKAASKKDLDNAIANKLAVEAALQSAKAQLLGAEINLGYTTITSPITGMADRAKYRQGALINPGANSLLTTVSIMDPIWVYFSISDSDILKTRQQLLSHTLTIPDSEKETLPKENAWTVQAIMSDESIYPYEGKVDFSSPTYDQSTGTMLGRAVFPNPKTDLRPGQFVKIKVFGAQRPNAIFVPQRALMQKKSGMFVYLIDKDNRVKAQDVSTGSWYENYQIITNGLIPGDRIVVDGINKIIAGTLVNVIGDWKSDTKGSE